MEVVSMTKERSGRRLHNRLWVFATTMIMMTSARFAAAQSAPADRPSWSLNATVIEACSCPMFCQCYFNSSPAMHAGHDGHGAMERYCRFNRALSVNRGHVGSTSLVGVKLWMAGDLGPDFSHDQYDWAVVTFDPSR